MGAPATHPAKAKPQGGTLRRHFSREPSLLTSLLLVFPLFLAYQLGVLLTPTMNGADFVTRPLMDLLRYNLGAYLLLNAGVALAFLLVALYLRKRQEFDWRLLVPVLIESSIYALTMGTVINLIMHPLARHLAAGGPPGAGPIDKLVLSIGAGVYEELVFRLILITALTAVCHRLLRMPKLAAVLVAFVVSAFLFSAAHHLGPKGDPLQLGVFVYRFLAGIIFAAIFYFRSFAIAVYTHALYDIYVMLIR